MAERRESGVLDTCAYIDLAVLDPATLPAIPEITAITMAAATDHEADSPYDR